MKKIDLHAHYISPGFSKFLYDYFDGKGDGVATPKFSPEGYLEFMVCYLFRAHISVWRQMKK